LQRTSIFAHFTSRHQINNENKTVFHPPIIAKAFTLIGFSAFAALSIAPTQAVIMDFNSLPNISASLGTTAYTENGFTLTDLKNNVGFYTTGNLSSTALYNASVDIRTRLTQVGAGSFTLSSIDLTSLAGDYSVTVTFTGTRADTSTITQSFTTDTVLSTLETFNFTDFTNLVSVDWNQNGSYHQFDNINVSSSTAVPEPLTVLGTIFGAGYGVALKRKLAKAKADKQDIG
jgi:hypothetical protein